MTRQTDPKDQEAVRLAINTVIENSEDPECISINDIVELMGYEIPDISKGESFGSISGVTIPVARMLQQMGYIKASVHLPESQSSVSRWLTGEQAKTYLARKGRRAYNKKRSSSSRSKPKSRSRSRAKSKSGERSGRTKAARKKGMRLIREMVNEGFSSAEIQAACKIGSGTVSRFKSPNPKYNYQTMEVSLLDRIEQGYEKLMSKRPTKRVAVKPVETKPVKVNGHKAVAKHGGISLPRSILDTEDPLTVIKALVDTGQSVTISADG